MTDTQVTQEISLEPSTPASCFVDLLVRDADWALVFWELTAEDIGRAKAALGHVASHSHLELRLYDVPRRPTSQPARVERFPINSWLGSRYVMLGPPGSWHMAAIGFANDDEIFVSMARSTWQRSPRSKASAAARPPRFGTASRTSNDSLAPLDVSSSGAKSLTDARPSPPHKGARTP